MTDPFGSLESARAMIDLQVQQARERSAAVSVLAEQVSTTTATVKSPNGAVSVTASAAAVITNVTLTAGALELTPAALGALVTETILRAQRAAAELALGAAEAALGTDSGFVAGLRDDVDSRFGPADDTTLR